MPVGFCVLGVAEFLPCCDFLGQSVPVGDIGAGQCGLVVGHGPWRERIRNIALFDAAAPGAEGPWVTFARMAALRTPKHLTGTDLGLPSLSFRAWYEAQHRQAGWSQGQMA